MVVSTDKFNCGTVIPHKHREVARPIRAGPIRFCKFDSPSRTEKCFSLITTQDLASSSANRKTALRRCFRIYQRLPRQGAPLHEVDDPRSGEHSQNPAPYLRSRNSSWRICQCRSRKDYTQKQATDDFCHDYPHTYVSVYRTDVLRLNSSRVPRQGLSKK